MANLLIPSQNWAVATTIDAEDFNTLQTEINVSFNLLGVGHSTFITGVGNTFACLDPVDPADICTEGYWDTNIGGGATGSLADIASTSEGGQLTALTTRVTTLEPPVYPDGYAPVEYTDAVTYTDVWTLALSFEDSKGSFDTALTTDRYTEKGYGQQVAVNRDTAIIQVYGYNKNNYDSGVYTSDWPDQQWQVYSRVEDGGTGAVTWTQGTSIATLGIGGRDERYPTMRDNALFTMVPSLGIGDPQAVNTSSQYDVVRRAHSGSGVFGTTATVALNNFGGTSTENRPRALCVSPDGSYVAACTWVYGQTSNAGKAEIFYGDNMTRGTELVSPETAFLRTYASRYFDALCFSWDNQWLVIADENEEVYFYEQQSAGVYTLHTTETIVSTDGEGWSSGSFREDGVLVLGDWDGSHKLCTLAADVWSVGSKVSPQSLGDVYGKVYSYGEWYISSSEYRNGGLNASPDPVLDFYTDTSGWSSTIDIETYADGTILPDNRTTYVYGQRNYGWNSLPVCFFEGNLILAVTNQTHADGIPYGVPSVGIFSKTTLA